MKNIGREWKRKKLKEKVKSKRNLIDGDAGIKLGNMLKGPMDRKMEKVKRAVEKK